MPPSRLRYGGFSYIELIISVSVIALTLAFAGPSLQSYSQTQQVKNTARRIYMNLQLARMTAIKRNQNVTANFILNGSGSPSMTIQDSNAQDLIPPVNFSIDAPEVTLGWRGPSPGVVTYRPMGTINGTSQVITVAHNDPQVTTTYEVTVNGSGGLKLEKK